VKRYRGQMTQPGAGRRSCAREVLQRAIVKHDDDLDHGDTATKVIRTYSNYTNVLSVARNHQTAGIPVPRRQLSSLGSLSQLIARSTNKQ
jgi:hypothetical protein